jgi:hypothetical protein
MGFENQVIGQAISTAAAEQAMRGWNCTLQLRRALLWGFKPAACDVFYTYL